jgi:DNA-directed RNA polymerase
MDEKRFERQLKLEDDYQRAGYQKAVRRDQQNKQRHYGSHTSVGNVLRRELVGYIAEALKHEYNTRIMKGQAGKGYVNLFGIFPPRTSWAVVAHIGLSTLLDYVMVPRTPIAYVHRKIGSRVEDELMLRHFRSSNPELFKQCRKDYIRATAGYRQKVYSTAKVFRNAMRERHDKGFHDEAEAMTWHRWVQDTQLAVGAWIVSVSHGVFSQLTDGMKLLEKITIAGKSGHRDYSYVFGPDVKDIEDSQLVQRAMRASYEDLPMVCQPIPWGAPTEEHPEGIAGGFITNSVTRRYDLVRRGTSLPSQQALDALNALQNTAWRINPFVFEQVLHFYQRGESINASDSFRPYLRPESYDIPKLPVHLVDIPDPRTATNEVDRLRLQSLREEQKKAKRELKRWHDRDADRRKQSEIFRLVVTAAMKFKDEDRFWIPWSFDFRTRMYPISILNPQSAEYVNAMMMFADGHPIDDRTQYWLAVHVATTRGFSKETFEGRVSWVQGNLHEIEAVATDPLGHGRIYWTEYADEPWMYLAACREYYEIFIEKSKTTTHIPCGIDATASGLQILGALMGDTSTCQLVNVIPTEKPSDLYQAVIDKCTQLIKDDRPRRRGIPLEKLSRSVAKAPVMTRAYGSTAWTRKGQVFDACNSKRGLELGLKWDKIEYIAQKLDDAMRLVLPGAEFVLDWLQRTAVASMMKDKDKKEIVWETASGCIVHQRYMEETMRRAQTVALGSTKYYEPRVVQEGEDPKLTKVESSTAANVVHSCDAAIIHLTVPSLGVPVSVTHDCGYARAGEDMDRLAEALRTAFVQVASFPVLETFAEMNGVPELAEEVTQKRNNDFDPAVAMNSRYLFC